MSEKNGTWAFVDLALGNRPVSCRWVMVANRLLKPSYF